METQQAHDAAFAIVLHRYIVSRAMHGETVTDVTAAGILEIALRIGMEPACDLGLLGFRLGPNSEVHPLSRSRAASTSRRARYPNRNSTPCLPVSAPYDPAREVREHAAVQCARVGCQI